MQKFKTIMIDPPWQQTFSGSYSRPKHTMKKALPYPSLTIDQIKSLPVRDMAEEGCHLWLWTTNSIMEQGFSLIREWGFTYLAPIHWIKPSGIGNWFVHRTQTVLFAYSKKCIFPKARYLPNVFQANTPRRHSAKPEEAYRLVESISPSPRIELFARHREGDWSVWGNEVDSDIKINLEEG